MVRNHRWIIAVGGRGVEASWQFYQLFNVYDESFGARMITPSA